MLSVMLISCDCTAEVPPSQARWPSPLGTVNRPGSLGSGVCCCQLRVSNQPPCASVLQTAVGGAPPNSARRAKKLEGESALEGSNSIDPFTCNPVAAASKPPPTTLELAKVSA